MALYGQRKSRAYARLLLTILSFVSFYTVMYSIEIHNGFVLA